MRTMKPQVSKLNPGRPAKRVTSQVALAASKKADLTSVVNDRYPLADAATASGQAARRTGLKVIIEPAP